MLRGIVIKGDGIGKILGFPTANIDTPKAKVKYTLGVYAATTTLGEKKYNGALVIRDNPWKIEMFLFDYDGPDFYGDKIAIDPLQKTSMIEKMGSKKELKEKIAKDIQLVKDYFNK